MSKTYSRDNKHNYNNLGIANKLLFTSADLFPWDNLF